MIHPRDPRLDVLTTFGLGHMRPASGTWGSLPPVVVAGVLIALGFGPDGSPVVYHATLIAILVACSVACIAWGDLAEAVWKKDPSEVVADETAGQCVPLLALPVAAGAPALEVVAMLALAFFAFRGFDILKPPPARGWQRLPAGWGILVDDLAAGVYALVVVQGVALIASALG